MKLNENYHLKMINFLKKEFELYNNLKEILTLEREALTNFDYEKLSDLNLKKEGILLNIVEIKKLRNNYINEICEKFHFDFDNFNLTFLASISEEKFKKIYEDFKVKFKKIGNEIKNLNMINKFAIETSLNFIEKSLNLIHQNVSPFTYSSYGKIVNRAYSNKAPTFYTGKI